MLKNAKFIIGNSSAGIREAPYYGIPVINIGTRQQNRTLNTNIINVDYQKENIDNALQSVGSNKIKIVVNDFGDGNSTELFLSSLLTSDIWKINQQKQFNKVNFD